MDRNSVRNLGNIHAATRTIKPEHIVYELPNRVNAQPIQRLLHKKEINPTYTQTTSLKPMRNFFLKISFSTSRFFTFPLF